MTAIRVNYEALNTTYKDLVSGVKEIKEKINELDKALYNITRESIWQGPISKRFRRETSRVIMLSKLKTMRTDEINKLLAVAIDYFASTENNNAGLYGNTETSDKIQKGGTYSSSSTDETHKNDDSQTRKNDTATSSDTTADSAESATPAPEASGESNSGTSDSNSGSVTKGEEIVSFAKQFIGLAYVSGGSTPAGFDCSGFTQYVYKQFGYSINRTATDQRKDGVGVNRDQLQAGDLVCFQSEHGAHVGIYIGDGQFIHSPHTGDSIKISNIDSDWYRNHYVCARRII